MESNHLTVPPAFLGSGFRQNHQIRALKTNSYPILTSHRSLQPSSSHTSPSLALLTTRGTALGSNFSRSNLTSHRRKHLRKCYDLVHICIQQRQLSLAGRFLKVILGAHEWNSDELFRLCLLLLSLSKSEEEEREGDGGVGKVEFLQMLDLESSSTFKATHITPVLIEEHIATGRLKDAIELLEERVNVHPYKGQPELHCLLGMMYCFVGVQTLLNSHREGGEGVELRKLDRTTKQKARLCFETTLQVSETWIRSETTKRQRIWGIRKSESEKDKVKLGRQRILWSLNPIDDEEGWGKVEEHPDLTKVRRRMKGRPDEINDGEGEERDAGNEGESSTSGSVYSLSPSPCFSEDEEERGQSRTRTQPQTSPVEPSSPPLEDPAQNDEERIPKHGPRAWSKSWPEIAPIWTPTPPPSVLFAKQFLSLLTTHHQSQTQNQREREGVKGKKKRKLGKSVKLSSPFFTDAGEEEEGGEGGIGGRGLTEEEAELRLRRILFQDDPSRQDEGGRGDRKKAKGGK